MCANHPSQAATLGASPKDVTVGRNACTAGAHTRWCAVKRSGANRRVQFEHCTRWTTLSFLVVPDDGTTLGMLVVVTGGGIHGRRQLR